MKLRHVISASQFDKKTIQQIFTFADKVQIKNTYSAYLKGKIMATLFYEPSTRTRLSFESAILRLGGKVISTESAAEFSSAAKGETLEDTIRVVNSFADVIVLRHFDEGASQIASEYSKVPIINAGDGKGEHPSQALLDLYTIFSKFKNKQKQSKELNLDITISMVGDLKNGRTIHSLTILLSLFPGVKFIFVSPKALDIPNHIKKILEEKKASYMETINLELALKESDVIYQTRVQKERFNNLKEYKKFKNLLIINKNSLTQMKKEAIIMHPLPRVNEITPEVDNDPRAMYFQQVQNGLFVRMALLIYLFDNNHKTPHNQWYNPKWPKNHI